MRPILTIEIYDWKEIKFIAEAILYYSEQTAIPPNDVFNSKEGVLKLLGLSYGGELSSNDTGTEGKTREKEETLKEA